ncbi:MAG: magnesium transporter MgtE [Candidatus Hydrogenedentota bacterium]
MADEHFKETWKTIREFEANQDTDGLREFVHSLTPGDIARALTRLSDDEKTTLLTLLPPDEAAGILAILPEVQGAEIIEELTPEQAAAILDEMESATRADVLGSLEDMDVEAILKAMDPAQAEDTRVLLNYDPDTAGGLMITEFLYYEEDQTIADVLSDLRTNADTYADYGVQYVYVVSHEKKLVGVIRLRDLVLSPGLTPLVDVMIKNPLNVNVKTSLDDLRQLFDQYNFFGVPVVDDAFQIVGVVQRDDVKKRESDVAGKAFMRFSGIIGGEELRSMPNSIRAIRRLAFLTPNIFLNLISASVIAMYEKTLAQVIMLAVFMPIISDMSGCSGNQAVAVSIRELSIGVIKPRDFIRVWLKEMQVGVPNGIALGIALGLIVLIWSQNIYLASVVGGALLLNTIVGACIGGLIPLGLKVFKVDPALASAPILTTVTDMLGFFFMLGFASLALSMGLPIAD